MPFEDLKRKLKEGEIQEAEERNQKAIEGEESHEQETQNDFERIRETHFKIVGNYNLLKDQGIDPTELLEQLAKAMGNMNEPTVNFYYTFYTGNPFPRYAFKNSYSGALFIKESENSKTPNEVFDRIVDTPGVSYEELLFSSHVGIRFELILEQSRDNYGGQSWTDNHGVLIEIGENDIRINKKVFTPISYEEIVRVLTQICEEENYILLGRT